MYMERHSVSGGAGKIYTHFSRQIRQVLVDIVNIDYRHHKLDHRHQLIRDATLGHTQPAADVHYFRTGQLPNPPF